ncbi:hypothetical protein ACQR1I_20330 [Bradyrhizobium sp. HKCCYLS2038]|uniref:hypothetical protein n=1 Tax=unclassified Bradyrhizobium TaxID=2631580 RepID=UPI003EB84F3A
MRVVTDWKECALSIESILQDDQPLFLGRVGGSDTNAVAALLEAKRAGQGDLWGKIYRHRLIVERYNGYYDLDNRGETFWNYINSLLESYRKLKHAFFCNHQLLSMYFRSNINPDAYVENVEGKAGFEALVEEINDVSPDFRCYPFPFVEKLTLHDHTLMHVFAGVLESKSVLVVSPFSESIAQNFHNRSEFFRNYAYPSFELKLYNTPITYSGLPKEFYPHKNWFETVEAMKSEIRDIRFDIALLCCGSYAMPLGDFIAEQMGRKAIYVGGILQMMFGIMGRRYENPFFTSQINPEKFIYPVEGQRYLQHVKISPEMAKEAFAAYF